MQAFKRFNLLLLVVMVAMMIMACATMNKMVTPTPLTPKQQAIVWGNLYNSEYVDFMTVKDNPLATQAQKDIANKKKALLVRVYPLLKAYNAPVLSADGKPVLGADGKPTGEIKGGDALTTMAIEAVFAELTALEGGM